VRRHLWTATIAIREASYAHRMTLLTEGPPIHAEIGVIGGSGFYSFLDDVTEVEVQTPFGPPSDPLVLGDIGGRRVAFLPRHGRDHRHPPHKINYRANLWALRWAGARQILGPCAVGSLKPDLLPATIVIPDQLVDRTTGREQTYFDHEAVHVSFSDPYCAVGRATAIRVATESGLLPVDGGALVVIPGPRFSTRAESRWYAEQGWAIIGMTGHPEAILARELELCYTSIAMVTDHDAGVSVGEGVTHEEVLRVFAHNLTTLRTLLYDLIPKLPVTRTCECQRSLVGFTPTIQLP
jgi:5'-methylthioadenosine phosphorylase